MITNENIHFVCMQSEGFAASSKVTPPLPPYRALLIIGALDSILYVTCPLLEE